MANWCSNYLHATGGNVNGLHELLESARKHTLEKNEGWMMSGDKYLFDIERNGDQWNFETRWSPPIDEIVLIARILGVSVEMDYAELSMNVYGVIRYDHTTGKVVDVFLDDSDFDRLEYDEEKDVYRFDGKEYDSEYEPLDMMMESKKKGGDQ